MKPLIFMIILMSGFLAGCEKQDGKIIRYDDRNEGNTDVTTMATPNGGKLNPAEEGAERSALGVPAINLDSFRLEITGLVDSSFSLTWEQIQALPAAFSDTMLMYCVEGWEVWGNWKGIPVRDLLDMAHIRPEGEYVHFGCADGYATSLPVAYLNKYNILLAYEVNGSPLQEHDGFPLRVIAFGKYGYKWAKWVDKMEVIDASQLGFWEMRGYSDRADVPISRRRFYEGPDAEPLEY
ncbi:molybdopterin-dependent oxidoreductase [bacterium]|nr:molybdopterin-dependent oxidoreductase [bacterium]